MRIAYILLLVVLLNGFWACGPAGTNETGHEYMPDMFHSIAYEANYFDYYKWNTWGTKEAYYDMAMPRKQVEGTVPFGRYPGESNAALKDQIFQIIPANGQVPYAYGNTEDERNRAMEEINTNPFPITEKGLDKGKELYTVYCGICHGEKAEGNGYLVRDDGGVYPAQPANLVNEEFTAASAGRFYHAIMHGKNVMLGYSDKLSYEERWQVIHYIRSLQAKGLELEYSENENTLNEEAIPYALKHEVESSEEESLEKNHQEAH